MANLHAYFGGIDTSFPQHFVLRWANHTAGFQRTAPRDLHKLETTAKWHGVTINLYSDVEVEPIHPRVPNKSKVSFLKSHLQKCVRRSKTSLAVQTANALCDADPAALLRRLPIIMIEDVAFHTAMPVLVWLMVAQVELTEPMRTWLLGVVADLAAETERDPVPPHHDSDPRPPAAATIVKRVIERKETTGLSDAAVDAVLTIMLRHAYGGMRGDMQMLALSADRMVKRYGDDGTKGIILGASNQTIVSSPLNPADCEVAAVDFHICRVAEHLASKLPFDVEAIKTAMWRCSSRITNKTPIHTDPDPVVQTVWSACKSLHEQFGRQYIAQIMSS